MSLGPYASFIVTAYVAAAVVIVTLIVWVALDYRNQKQHLRELEAKGIVRRSAQSASTEAQ